MSRRSLLGRSSRTRRRRSPRGATVVVDRHDPVDVGDVNLSARVVYRLLGERDVRNLATVDSDVLLKCVLGGLPGPVAHDADHEGGDCDDERKDLVAVGILSEPRCFGSTIDGSLHDRESGARSRTPAPPPFWSRRRGWLLNRPRLRS